MSLDRFLLALHRDSALSDPLDAVPHLLERNDVLDGNPAAAGEYWSVLGDAQLAAVGVEQAPAFGLLVDAPVRDLGLAVLAGQVCLDVVKMPAGGQGDDQHPRGVAKDAAGDFLPRFGSDALLGRVLYVSPETALGPLLARRYAARDLRACRTPGIDHRLKFSHHQPLLEGAHGDHGVCRTLVSTVVD